MHNGDMVFVQQSPDGDGKSRNVVGVCDIRFLLIDNPLDALEDKNVEHINRMPNEPFDFPVPSGRVFPK